MQFLITFQFSKRSICFFYKFSTNFEWHYKVKDEIIISFDIPQIIKNIRKNNINKYVSNRTVINIFSEAIYFRHYTVKKANKLYEKKFVNFNLEFIRDRKIIILFCCIVCMVSWASFVFSVVIIEHLYLLEEKFLPRGMMQSPLNIAEENVLLMGTKVEKYTS